MVFLRSGALQMVSVQNKEVGSYYQQQIREHRTRYMQCWSRLLAAISDSRPGMLGASPAANRPRDRDRQQIKDAFNTFNKEFETLITAQKGYSIPDREVAASIKKECIDLIDQKYKTFYGRWNSVEFSKNPEKYIKYKPEDVLDALSHLFEIH